MDETKTPNRVSDKQWMSIRGNIRLAVSKASREAHADSSYWLITLLDNAMRLADQYCHSEPDRVDEARKCLMAMADIKLPVEPGPKIQMKVTVGDGKYTVIQREGEGLRALRYGDPWRDCTGDGLIYGLAAEVASLRGSLEDAKQSKPIGPEIVWVVESFPGGIRSVHNDREMAVKEWHKWREKLGQSLTPVIHCFHVNK